MSVRVAINGMGVIGRELFRMLFEKEGYEIAFINDTHITPANLKYLLQFDSLYPSLELRDRVSTGEESIIVNGRGFPLCKFDNALDMPLGELKVDVMLECEGYYNTKFKAEDFIAAGARKAIICQSAGKDLPTIAYNVNHDTLKANDTIISIPQMETQVAAQVFNALKQFKVKNAYCKAFRSYTNSQNTMDSYNPNGNFALGRAAAWNITPLVAGFGNTVGLIVPEVNSKVKSMSYRAPVINGSVMDITLELDGTYSTEVLNAALKAAATESFGYSEDPLCSTDAIGNDMPQMLAKHTQVLQNESDKTTLANITVIYDNVRHYCREVARVAKYFSELA